MKRYSGSTTQIKIAGNEEAMSAAACNSRENERTGGCKKGPGAHRAEAC